MYIKQNEMKTEICKKLMFFMCMIAEVRGVLALSSLVLFPASQPHQGRLLHGFEQRDS